MQCTRTDFDIIFTQEIEIKDGVTRSNDKLSRDHSKVVCSSHSTTTMFLTLLLASFSAPLPFQNEHDVLPLSRSGVCVDNNR